ncbi:MAG TPA: hypothetical protein VL460_09685 [Caulobacteraceae bacterium]|jgi:hypothetical protein|nr:hypothetical protein [Caulobacteraceae bacterium]
MDRKALQVAAVTGAVAQVLLVLAGHFVVFIADNLFALGGLAIAAAAGVIYARRAAPGPILLGGAVAGGLGAAVGIALSALLGDVPWSLILLGGLAGAVAGAAGAGVRRALSQRRPGRASPKP